MAVTQTRAKARVADMLNRAPAWKTFLIVFVPTVAGYAATMARYDRQSNFDAVASALPAWRLSQFGDIDLSQFAQLPWIVEVGDRIVSNRPPGISFLASPLYWLFGSPSYGGAVPSMLPATATAVLASALAVAVLHLVFRRLTSPAVAVGAALVFGFGTSTWSISANELWPHGPAQLFLALALLGLSANRLLAAGVAYGAALLVRPITAVIAGVTGLVHGRQARSWRTVALVGIGSGVGLGLLLLYNRAVLGTWSPAPPTYGQSFVDRAASQSVAGYARDVAGMLFHHKYSLFLYSPFLVFTVPGLISGWRESPFWVKASALGGLAYILIHLRLNRFWGGISFNYRYPLEMLTVMAPLLFLSWRAWYSQAGPRWRMVFWASVGLSLVTQVMAIVPDFTNGYLI